jgi:hypothetical protein
VVVEEVAAEEDHVDIALLGEAHDFVKGAPCVVAADGGALEGADVAVGGYQDANRVWSWIGQQTHSGLKGAYREAS